MRFESDPLIRIDFVNADTGEVFAYTEMASGQLPESFEANTTMHFGDQAWTIVRATPMTAVEFRRSGHLLLEMRKAVAKAANPSEVLYSIPTIEDKLPGIAPDTSKLNKRVLEITEDDWRQVEFIAAHREFRIDREIEAIRTIVRDHREGPGYRSIYVREAMPAPLEGAMPITKSELTSLFGPGVTLFDGLGYRGKAGLIEGGFALETAAHLQLYGTVQAGTVYALGLHGLGAVPTEMGAPNPLWREVHTLSDFMRRKKIVLTAWCSMQKLLPGTSDLFEFFSL